MVTYGTLSDKSATSLVPNFALEKATQTFTSAPKCLFYEKWVSKCQFQKSETPKCNFTKNKVPNYNLASPLIEYLFSLQSLSFHFSSDLAYGNLALNVSLIGSQIVADFLHSATYKFKSRAEHVIWFPTVVFACIGH